MTTRWLLTLTLALSFVAGPAAAERRVRPIIVSAVDKEPRGGRRKLSAAALRRLRRAVKRAPTKREPRLALVRALMRAGRFEEALEEAKRWRARDAYNLVVMRLIGDLYSELGRPHEARRAYSAVVEALPGEATAHRALATVLKQTGHLEDAYQRLKVAHKLAPDSVVVAFELADVALRTGRLAEATAGFEALVADRKARRLREPARYRLAQAYMRQRAAANKSGDEDGARKLARRLKKLRVPLRRAIKVYMTWDVPRVYVDLWVVNPAGERVTYSHREGKFGGWIGGDIDYGYGPQIFTSKRAVPGTYTVQVHYYGSAGGKEQEARGEVMVVLYEGTAHERRVTLPYRIFERDQLVTVARLRVKAFK